MRIIYTVRCIHCAHYYKHYCVWIYEIFLLSLALRIGYKMSHSFALATSSHEALTPPTIIREFCFSLRFAFHFNIEKWGEATRKK